MTIDILLKEVQKLPEAERMAFVERVLSSFASKELSKEQKAELDKRSDELAKGSVTLVSAAEFLSTLQARYAL